MCALVRGRSGQEPASVAFADDHVPAGAAAGDEHSPSETEPRADSDRGRVGSAGIMSAATARCAVRTRRGVLGALGVALAGCASRSGGADSDTTVPETDTTTPTAASHWYPHPQPSGNRTLDGAGNLRDADPVTIPIGDPAWLVAVPAQQGSDWVVVSDDGGATRYRVVGGEVVDQETYDPFARGVPVVRRADGSVTLVRPPASVSPMAPPTFADGGRTRLAPGTDGTLLVTRGTTERVDVGALADGRVVRVSEDRYALLGDRTDRYRHRALGDAFEGGSIVVVDARGTVETRRTVDPPAVIEAQAPLAADLDGDGRRELLVSVSDSADGARIAAFAPGGSRLATGPVHGSGWRHPLAVAPLGPGGDPELAVVRKPHVEHVLEFYRFDGTELSVRTTLRGFRSHTYGSRTLDGALAADFDGDGTAELLVPTTGRAELAAVSRTADGAAVDWRLPLDGTLRTNLAGTADGGGGVAVGAGTADGLRVWQG